MSIFSLEGPKSIATLDVGHGRICPLDPPLLLILHFFAHNQIAVLQNVHKPDVFHLKNNDLLQIIIQQTV